MIVDADISKACSERNDSGERYRQFLTAMLRICHRVALTDTVTEEWARHQSGWFRKWFKSMCARKKQVRISSVVSTAELRGQVRRLNRPDSARNAMLKDCHLIETALASDLIIVSRDNNAHREFAAAAADIRELGPIVWVNPDRTDVDLIEWLERGASPNAKLQLGMQRPE